VLDGERGLSVNRKRNMHLSFSRMVFLDGLIDSLVCSRKCNTS
jgi:hypothetical protein